ncbi:hypothetical protein O206_11120 [Ochrobactrum sp. EGD-AQ16]|nr:hypothetical protein O206_11120 [Ochrobactrum sp. EGD-AQ16]
MIKFVIRYENVGKSVGPVVMFGLFRDRRNEALATEFLQTTAYQVDSGYRLFVTRVAQTLANAHIVEETKKIISNNDTKYYYLIGVVCEQSRAALNLLPPGASKKFVNELKRQLLNSGLPMGDNNASKFIEELDGNFNSNPASFRIILVLMIAKYQGLSYRTIQQKLGNNPMSNLAIESTIMDDGTGSLMKDFLVKKGLIAPR